MEKEVLRVKHGISNSLNQLQCISIVDILGACNAARHVGDGRR